MTPASDDRHAHRNLEVAEEPLDAANQSLADALRSSFSILKGIMLVLVVLYLFSNVRTIEPHEQALRLRLGTLLPGVHDPGLVWSFPFPIDEIVPLPTKKSNESLIDSQTFHRRKNEETMSLAFISRSASNGLDPAVDGALLTADAGLVHTRWKVTYKITDVSKFVQNFLGDKVEAAEDLVRVYVETIGVQVASEMTAEELIRTRIDTVQQEMRHRINERLAELDSGVMVTLVEIQEPTPPLQIRDAFDATQRAENTKKKKIDEAEQESNQILNRVAGAAHMELLTALDKIEAGGTEDEPVELLQNQVDRALVERTEGEAGRLIKDATAYHAKVVGRIQSDVDLYQSLLPEYERNADVLIGRLWEQTRQRIFNSPGVTKVYRPPGARFWLTIPLDYEQTRLDEERRLREQKFSIGKLRPKKLVPLGPETD